MDVIGNKFYNNNYSIVIIINHKLKQNLRRDFYPTFWK